MLPKIMLKGNSIPCLSVSLDHVYGLVVAIFYEVFFLHRKSIFCLPVVHSLTDKNTEIDTMTSKSVKATCLEAWNTALLGSFWVRRLAAGANKASVAE